MILWPMAVLAFAQRQQPIESPYKQDAPLAIRSVTPEEVKVARNGLVELHVDLSASYQNPFDPAQVSLDAKVTPPTGTAFTVAGFLYRPFERRLDGSDEHLIPSGSAEWRIRFSPKLEGRYSLVVTAKTSQGVVSAPAVHVVASKEQHKGFATLSARDPRFFVLDDDTSFWPVGTNICWGDTRGTYAYDEWLPKYAENGVNYTRFWLSPAWTTFGMEQVGKPAEGKGMGQFDLGNAWRLDRVLGQARELGIFVMLCIESYNVLRAGDAYPMWEKTPQNQDNGGPLRIPSDFWTNDRMDKLFRDKLRYLVARYGAYSNTFSWEFWNEVDLTSDFDPNTVAAWHRKMGQYLRSIDPYDHLITTSAASTMGYRQLDSLPELDYIQTHHYGEDPAGTVTFQQSRKGGSKPHYVGEIGADAAGARKEDDPKGIQIHDPMWAAIATGSSGAAISWWWDSLIAPNNLYSLFKPVAEFVKDVDWHNERFKQTTPTFAYQKAPKPAPRKDLEFRGGPVEWRASGANQPTRVTIRYGKASPGVVSAIQHGVVNHRDLHNPVAFDIDLDQPVKFEVEVGDVSGYGGAGLLVSIDDKVMINKNFADPDGDEKPDTLRKYAGKYAVTVPAGRHLIVVENPGKDWFMASYRFVDLIPRTAPAVDAWAVVGETKAMAWLRREGRTWRRAVQGQPGLAPATTMGLSGLAGGKWKCEVWDTWTGKVLRSSVVSVPVTGKVRVAVPAFASDLAVKLSRR